MHFGVNLFDMMILRKFSYCCNTEKSLNDVRNRTMNHFDRLNTRKIVRVNADHRKLVKSSSHAFDLFEFFVFKFGILVSKNT